MGRGAWGRGGRGGFRDTHWNVSTYLSCVAEEGQNRIMSLVLSLRHVGYYNINTHK